LLYWRIAAHRSRNRFTTVLILATGPRLGTTADPEATADPDVIVGPDAIAAPDAITAPEAVADPRAGVGLDTTADPDAPQAAASRHATTLASAVSGSALITYAGGSTAAIGCRHS
jgi:hypothetical protein